MSSIDQRIVEMKLDNKQFESGVSSTMSALDKLKAALKFDSAKKGITDLNNVGKGFTLDHIGKSVDSIKEKFSTMSVAGIAALGGLANKAVDFGMNQLGKMFEPAMDGFREYELKMNSIQTIMANTSRHGTSLETVNAELDKLNEYADLTIYNFAEMTRNASLFTASGMKIEDATAMIKGFSNEAAASGTNSTDAARAAYQLTQAMNNGVVKLQDWKSITNAGMGTANMRDGLIAVADSMGLFNDNTTTAQAASENFNGSLEKGWLTADVMSQYLQIMTGDMTEAEIAAMGFSKETAKMMYEQGQMGLEAATKVRTFSQLIGAAQEGIGSGWAQTMELLIGDFEAATELFSGVWKVLDGIIGRQADSRNNMIKDFLKLGGRDNIIQGVKNLYEAAMNFMGPIKSAWESVFGKKTEGQMSTMAKVLAAITKGFLKFTEFVKMGSTAFGKGFGGALIAVLTPIKMFFNVLGAIASVIGAVVIGIVKLASFMAVAGFRFAEMIAKSEAVRRTFSALKDIFDTFVDRVRAIGTAIADFGIYMQNAFLNLGDGFYEQAILALSAALETLGVPAEKAMDVANKLVLAWLNVQKAFASLKAGRDVGSVATMLQRKLTNLGFPVGDLRGKLEKLVGVMDFFRSMGDKVADKVEQIRNAFTGLKESTEGVEIQTAGVKNAWSGFMSFMAPVGRFLGNLASSLGDLLITGVDKFVNYVKTLNFQEILALVNTAFFIMAYRAIKQFMDNMGGVAKSFSETMDTIGEAIKGFAKKETYADKILKIAIAIGILAASAYVLAGVDAAALAKALGAIAVMLGELGVMMKIMSKLEFKEDAQIAKVAVTLALMSVAILILAEAATKFEGLSWNAVAKGLTGVAVLLGALALFTKIADLTKGNSIKSAASLIILAFAIKLLTSSVETLGNMDVGVLRNGLIVLGILLVGLAGMTKVLNNANLVSAAVGLLILSASLFALSLSLRYYATLDWNTLLDGLAKAAIVIAGIGIAARLLPGNLPATALGLILVAGAVALLVPALAMMGNLKVETLVQGLIGLAVGLGVIAAAMWVMSAPGVLAGAAALLVVTGALYLLLPIIVALGNLPLEVIAIGLGAMAAGLLILIGAGALAAVVAPGLLVLVAAILGIGIAVGIAGVGMALFGAGFAALVAALVTGGAVLITALESVIMMIPLFAQQLALGLIAFAVVIRDAGPAWVGAITTVLISILQAIRNATPEAQKTFAVMIMAMVTTVTSLAPQITERFAIMLLRILTTLREYVPQITEQALLMMHEFLSTVADNIGPIVDEATRLMVEFMDGIERNIPQLVESGERMVRTFIREVGAALLGGVGDMISSGAELAQGIIDGAVSGLRNGVSAIGSAATEAARSAWNSAMSFLGIKSPSRKFMWLGEMTDAGLAKGMVDNTGYITKAADKVGMEAILSMQKSLGRVPSFIDSSMNLSPTIRPVLDLTEIQNGSRLIDPMLSGAKISVGTSYEEAVAADSGYRSNKNTAEEISAQARETAAMVQFNQYNNSPKALDRIEIYRQTNNQLSRLKEGFSVTSS